MTRLFLLAFVLTLLTAGAHAAPTQSLFFTPNQLASILRANQGFIAPTEAFDPNNQASAPMDSGPRVIKLSGLLYHGKNDWVLWLNDQRVTPKTLPERVMSLNVAADSVRIRWMDIGRQRIVNFTLRPHQQYHLDQDTILPGTDDWGQNNMSGQVAQ